MTPKLEAQFSAFLEALKGCDYRWSIDSFDTLRTQRRDDDIYCNFCPIVALGVCELGNKLKNPNNNLFLAVARKLSEESKIRLTPSLAKIIAAIADNNISDLPPTMPFDEALALQNRLFKACHVRRKYGHKSVYALV